METNKMKKIELVYENCEVLTLDEDELVDFKYTVLEEDKDKVKTINNVELTLKIKDPYKKIIPFDIEELASDAITKKEMLLDRNDITQIHITSGNQKYIIPGNEKTESFYVVWPYYSHPCFNEEQKSKILENGNIVIEVKVAPEDLEENEEKEKKMWMGDFYDE